jgi:hypothetical protein
MTLWDSSRPVQHFFFVLSLGTRQTTPAGFFWSFLFSFTLACHDFILRRHRMIPISGRKDFRFASTSLFFSRW